MKGLSSSAIRACERALTRAARSAWPLVEKYNRAFARPSPSPAWAPAPLLKKRDRSFPPLGWPRETDSLCPECVKEVRGEVLSGKKSLRTLVDGKPGEIKARIELDGRRIV